jgi:hypothetical protein
VLAYNALGLKTSAMRSMRSGHQVGPAQATRGTIGELRAGNGIRTHDIQLGKTILTVASGRSCAFLPASCPPSLRNAPTERGLVVLQVVPLARQVVLQTARRRSAARAPPLCAAGAVGAPHALELAELLLAAEPSAAMQSG